MNTPKFKTQFRRALLLGLSTLTVSDGCASMKSPMGMFSRTPGSSEGTGFATSLSNAGKGIGGQVKSMGTTVSSAMGKAKDMVIAPFASTPETNDPTSLANMPTNLGPEIWVTQGQLYETQGKHEKALENYNKALEKEPNNEAALLSVARLYTRQQQNAQAETYFNKVLALKPQAVVYNELASVQQSQGKIAESQVSIQKAIELDPTSTRYRNNLAGMLVANGRSDEAVKQLEQVFPPAVANYNVAYLHFTNQNLPAAQQHLQLALQADPNLQEARALMEKISGSPTAQTAMAAYQTANQIYRTAQTAVTPSVPASGAVFQQPPSGTFPQATMPAPNMPAPNMPAPTTTR